MTRLDICVVMVRIHYLAAVLIMKVHLLIRGFLQLIPFENFFKHYIVEPYKFVKTTIPVVMPVGINSITHAGGRLLIMLWSIHRPLKS